MRNFLFILLLSGLCSYAQVSDETFSVKKKPNSKRTEAEKLFDLNLDPGEDTICKGLLISLEPVRPYYDSLAFFNLKRKSDVGRYAFFETTTIGSGGQAKLKFYQRQKDNSYKLVYIRSWVIFCK